MPSCWFWSLPNEGLRSDPPRVVGLEVGSTGSIGRLSGEQGALVGISPAAGVQVIDREALCAVCLRAGLILQI